MRRHLPLAITLIAVSGCSAFRDDHKPEPPTIASIEGKPVDIEAGGTLDATRTQAIESYRKFLNSAKQNQYHAEAMRRIADLELEALEERATRFTGSTGQKPVKAADYDRVVKLYNDMLRNHPNYPNNDGVLYQLAKVHEQSGEIEKALEVFDRLIKKYPRSQYYTEVQFRRGEILFVLRRYKEANTAYNAVLKGDKATPFYQRALYKHGWSEFKRSRYEEGLHSFIKLLDIKHTDPETGQLQEDIVQISRGERELMQDSFRVISLSFSYLDGSRSVDGYFKSNGQRPYGYRVYRNLGNLYMKQERIRDAADTYNAFVRSQPDHRLAPDFQTDVINAYKKGGFLQLTLKAKAEFAERYNKSSRYWQVQSEQDKQRIAKLLQIHLEDLARYYHAQAQKKEFKPAQKISFYRQAGKWYRLYVDSFPEDGKTPLMNFLLAEVLFESNSHLAAANEYEKTAYQYSTHPKQAEAGYAALLAFQAYEKTLSNSKRQAFHIRTINSGIKFADTFPTHKHTPSVLTSAAEDLYKARDLERAESIAQRVIKLQPPAKKDLRRTAWTVQAHIQFEGRRFADAEQSYLQVLRLSKPTDKLYKPMHERMVAAVYKQAEQYRDQNQHQSAVYHFLRIEQLSPKSDIAIKAQYDAATSLITLKNWSRAAQVLEGFRRKYPRHALSKTIPEKLAHVYLSSKQHGRAAGEMERIAASSNNPNTSREARWQAAELYEKSGAHTQAIRAYTNYFTQFPRPFERSIEARNKVAETYKRIGNRKQHQAWLKKIVQAEAKGGRSRTTRTRFVAASAAFTLAEPQYQAFRKIRLTIPLKRSLKRKKKSMQKALKTYEKIADYKISKFTTAASYKIAEIYHKFSMDLIKSQRPRNLKPDELEQYEVLLEEQAYPFEEKAIKIHDTNAARTADGIYDQWVQKSLAILRKLQPFRFNKPERSEVSIDAIE